MNTVRKKIMGLLSVLLVVSVFLSGISMQTFTVFADTADTISDVNADATTQVSSNNELTGYADYIKNCGISNKATGEVSVPINEFVSADGADAVLSDGAVDWNNGDGSVIWTFNVDQAGLYNLRIDWVAMGSGVNPNFGVLIDGQYLFEGSDEVVLPRIWKNATDEPRSDAQGNEYAQEQIEVDNTVTTVLQDKDGVVVDPYEFALSAGTHTIAFAKIKQGISIKAITFIAPEVVKAYQAVDAKAVDADIITIEGEKADFKNSDSLIPKANTSDVGMTPNDAYTTKINYIGGTSWQSAGSTLTWNFNVEKDGYYYINIRYKQSDLVNGESWRWLKIDGKTPFEEAKSLRFPYGTSWKYYTFGADEGEPYYIWLDEGPHTLSMEVTVGNQSEYFNRLKEFVDTLNDEYIKIVMITSESPDVNRDYELFKQIPNHIETLEYCRDGLNKLVSDMTSSSSGNASQAASAIKNMSRVLNNMIENKFSAQDYVNDYYTNYTSISSWLYDMIDMPLAIDQIQLVPAGKEFKNNNANIFESVYYSAVRLISSFTTDYTLTNSEEYDPNNTVRLWVNWGQDQTSVLNSIIQDSFTAETGIDVQLEIVSASLINGILAGNFPDLSLHLSRTEPVNLGIRGALVDLTQYDDYEQVLNRFQVGAEIPYTYKGAAYALPDTQNFYIMFYRTDILERLGLEIPTTWEEFLHCATIIQRNNMSVYVPYTQIVTSTTVNAGIGNLNLYPTLMAQNNLSIYNEDRTGTAMTSKKALDVFEMWTDFYNEYDFLKEADFYNRLRVGVMPLGVAPYTTYMSFYSAAPEIRGRWSIAKVPGTVNEDGSINYAVAGSGTGCGIIKQDNKQRMDNAWEFLKWWTSAETQARYNNNVESILGAIGRTAVSNVDAFNSIAWDSEDLEVLNDQWSDVVEVEEIPGSYYLTRAVDQAFWAVLEDDESVKDAVVKWSKVADNEIERKIEEYF